MLTTLILTNCILTAYVTTGNLDASGSIPVQYSTIASGRRDIPLGSKVTIGNYTFTLNDHMNKRFNGQNRFDIFFGNNLKAAKEFGIKHNITITIYEQNRTSHL